jgi:hypothetical protein
MAWDVETRTLEPPEFPAWETFVAGAPGGSVYSLPAYVEALCTAIGGRYRVLAVKRNDEIVGGVALYERDAGGGTFVSPRLLLYYNGVVVRRYDTQYPSENTSRHVKILTSLEAKLATLGFGSMSLRSRDLLDVRPFLAAGWKADPSYSYVVPLELEAAWGRIEQNLRRLIDRARNDGLAFSDDDDFDAFFHLHAMTLDRHGTGVYLPRAVFKTFFHTLHRQSLARLFHIRTSEGRAVASQLVLLGGHRVCHTASAGAEPEFNKRGATALLRWNAFERLASLGYQGNDLTDAALNPVTHFKSQLGGTLELSFTLQSPLTRRFRWATGASDALSRSRRIARAMARRVLRRDGNKA